MRIDAHQHFWKYDSFHHAWINESMYPIRKDFMPGDLWPILKENNIDGSIAVQALQSETETEFLLACAEKNAFIKGVVGWLNLLSKNVEERLLHYSKNKLFKGVRHIVQAEADEFMLQPDFQYGLSKLEPNNLTYDILIFPHQLKAACVLVKKFPLQKFVVDHLAKPLIKDGIIDGWKQDIEELAKFPNVHCKVSGFATEADKESWEPSHFKPYLDIIFNAFGTDRILYGSDWPVCLLAADYREQLGVVESYIENFSEEDKKKVMGENAVTFYALET